MSLYGNYPPNYQPNYPSNQNFAQPQNSNINANVGSTMNSMPSGSWDPQMINPQLLDYGLSKAGNAIFKASPAFQSYWNSLKIYFAVTFLT